MSASESIKLQVNDATVFTVKGGRYLMNVVGFPGATYGTVTLQQLGADGATYLTPPATLANPALTSGAFAANGCAIYDLAPGAYEVVPALTVTKTIFDAAMAAVVTAYGTWGTTTPTYSTSTHQFSSGVAGTPGTGTDAHANAVATAMNTAMTTLLAYGPTMASVIALLDIANADFVTAFGVGGTTSLSYSSTTHQFSGSVTGTTETLVLATVNTALTAYNTALAAFIARGAAAYINITSVPLV